MANYSLPSSIGVPTKQSFQLVTNTKSFKSPLSGAVQTVGRKGSHWKTRLTFENLTGSQRSELQGVLARLNGQEHRLLLRDFGAVRTGNAPATDSPTLYDNRVGDYIILANVAASVTGYFKAGDYLAFNNELHMVVQDAHSNSANRVGVYISPPVRNAPTPGDPATIVDATTPFIVTSSASWETKAPSVSSFTIEAIEDVLA